MVVEEFDCEPLNGEESGLLEVQLDLSKVKDLNLIKYGMIMMRILDDNNVIMGDSKDDNLLIFIKINKGADKMSDH